MSRVEAQQEKKKKTGAGAWIYRIIMILLIGVMAFSGYNLYKIYSEYHKGTVTYNDLADAVGANKGGADNSRLHIDWDELMSRNKDVIAWLRCKDTVINYPVVQGLEWDNKDSYHNNYLVRTIDGEYNGKGTLFIDWSNKNPFKDFNTIIYGHRMKDGSMFHSLTEYFGSGGAEYYKAHPTIELYTKEQNYDIHIFACATVDATDLEWYRTAFNDANGVEDPEWTQAYLNKVYASNVLDGGTDVEVTTSDRIVMLSTCTAQSDHHREVVWGKLVPVEETE